VVQLGAASRSFRVDPDRTRAGRVVEGSMKDIIVNLTVDAARDMAADYAISVAHAFGAHVAGIGFSYETPIPGSVFGSAAVRLIEAQRVENEKAAKRAIANFDAGAHRLGLSAESRFIDASLTVAAKTFGELARRFDLSVVAQVEPGKLSRRELMIEAALFESGRPVLIVPYIQQEGLKLDRVTVCWDGSRNAARALADAMPLLARAKTVEAVVVSGEPAKSTEIRGADIAHHLARHGLNVQLREITAADLDVANTILSHAADVGSDLIVMGGYGHSRLREFVLGGVTRGLLISMTVPTLMSH
jgi:nucleotide-binding universal stress UspA family protein